MIVIVPMTLLDANALISRWHRHHKPGYRRGVSYTRVVYEPTTEIVDRVRWETGPDAAPELPELAHLGRRRRDAA